MNEARIQLNRDRWRQQIALGLTFFGFGIIVAGILVGTRYFEMKIGPKQPIPFSHRVHAHNKNISCFICHPGAHYSANAGVPEVETCMLCHSKIIITYPPIRDLRQHYFGSTNINWNRVRVLPGYVYFNHSVHIQRGIDCGRCHGDVQQMDRIKLTRNINMGFCMQCHREHNATHDCFTCHR